MKRSPTLRNISGLTVGLMLTASVPAFAQNYDYDRGTRDSYDRYQDQEYDRYDREGREAAAVSSVPSSLALRPRTAHVLQTLTALHLA